MTDPADCHGDRIAITEARREGFYLVVLGRNPPEIAYWERGETWLAGRAPGDLEARCIVIAVVSGSAACGSLFLTVGVATIGRGSRS